MSNGINVNPLNDITKVYLNQIANAKAKETEKDIERWTQAEETECNESPKGKDCDVHGMKECPDPVQEEMGKKKNCGCGQNPCITYGKQDNKSMKEEKKAKKDYDGDGKVESGSKEHAGVVHNAIQKKKGGKADGQDTRKEDVEIDEGIGRTIKKVKRLAKRHLDTFDSDPGKAHTIGTLGNPHVGNEDKRAAERKAGKGKKMKESTIQDLTKVYLNQVSEHHQKDENGNTIPHEDELDEAERSLGDRLHRKRKLYDKTTKKAMQFARDEGEASGHARYRMSSISREMDGIKAKMKKEK